MGIDTSRNIYREIANSEAYWRGQRDRWRVAFWIAAGLLLVCAVLAWACQ